MDLILTVLGIMAAVWAVGVILWAAAIATYLKWRPAVAIVLALFWPIAWPLYGSWILHAPQDALKDFEEHDEHDDGSVDRS